jgi:hypothetical protein
MGVVTYRNQGNCRLWGVKNKKWNCIVSVTGHVQDPRISTVLGGSKNCEKSGKIMPQQSGD